MCPMLNNHLHTIQEIMEAHRCHYAYDFTTVSLIFFCHEFYFTDASSTLLPRVLMYRREFTFVATSFIIPLRVLLYCYEFRFIEICSYG